MQRVGEPAHDLFSEEIKLYRPVFEKDIIPHGDPFLSGRKLYSDPLAAMGDIKDRFDRHRGNLVGRSEARDYQVREPAYQLAHAPFTARI